jgi:glucose dehydrogenase
MWAGTVSTAGGVVFTGDDDGNLVALDARTGKDLWHFSTGWAASAIWAHPAFEMALLKQPEMLSGFLLAIEKFVDQIKSAATGGSAVASESQATTPVSS